MFLRSKTRRKDGKEHRYWSIVENRRVAGGRVVQRQVLYLGEINDAQKAAWCRTIEVVSEDEGGLTQVALFPEDRLALVLDCDVIQVRLSALRLRRPRQWGACWLMFELWAQLRLDDFWAPRLLPSRKSSLHRGSLPSSYHTTPDPQLVVPTFFFEEQRINSLLREKGRIVEVGLRRQGRKGSCRRLAGGGEAPRANRFMLRYARRSPGHYLFCRETLLVWGRFCG
jgi:hypothetical protein